MALLAYWVNHLNPFVIRFGENFGIRWYGLAYLAGFVSAAWLFRLYYKKGRTPLDPNASLELILYLAAGVMIGGRIGSYFLYDGWTHFREDPLGLFKVWEGGMASHGGFVGVFVAACWFARTRQVSFFHLADLVASTASAGLLFGRLANFINGELWGKVTDVPWAVIFPRSAVDGTPALPRHPSQLYEAGLEGALLLAFVQWRFWRSDVTKTQPGRLAGEYLIAYAAVRTLGELFREPDASLILGFSRGTFYSFFLVVGGVALIARARRSKREA
jgi:phosphatidylglycerol:prolipoprotein diacylglycerol transferase